MGEHKRQKQINDFAKSEKQNKGTWIEEMALPVDAEIFKFVSQTYHAAARLTMPVENPSARPVAEIDGQLISFTDTPINRGMLAARNQLGELNASPVHAYLCRLMHFGEILGAYERFGPLIKVGDEPEALMVSEAVLYAAATARFNVTEEHMSYDIDDAVRIAQEYAASHPDDE